jgi:hypothetical protein
MTAKDFLKGDESALHPGKFVPLQETLIAHVGFLYRLNLDA